MHLGIRTLAVALLATGLMTAGLPPAQAETDTFVYGAVAGGTRITAVGSTVTSDLTAESSVFGWAPSAETNKALDLFVSNLARIETVHTDARSEALGNGFRAVSHARTADVNLLNGLVRATAVDTTSTAASSSTSLPAGSTTSGLVGLVIGGKAYPAGLPPNTGITVPGVATVVVNYSRTAVEGDGVVTFGAGLLVTLLKPRNGIAAGAEVVLNPTYATVSPRTRTDGGVPLGGFGFGAYVNGNVGDEVGVETGLLGAQFVPMSGTDGRLVENTTANVNVRGVLTADAIRSTAYGISTPAVSETRVTSTVSDLRVIPQLLGSVIQATAIGTSATVRLDSGGVESGGTLQFVNLRIAGRSIPVDVGENTAIHVDGLGTVTVNKRDRVDVPGVVHGYQVAALEIVLDTERAGLPVGAVIQVGVSRAVVWG